MITKPMTMLIVEFSEDVTDGKVRDLAELIRNQACVRSVRGLSERMVLINEPKPKPKEPPIYAMRIYSLDLSTRALNCLAGENIHTVGDLMKISDRQLRREIANLGSVTADEITQKLAELGLTLRSY